MINPAKQKIIQIDITNACPHKCSNCTRFVGHHKKSFFMDPEFFRKAISSLKEYKGMIGVMGGEPTIHPKFVEIVSMLPKLAHPECAPIKDFSEYRKTHLANLNHRYGLWTSLGEGYYKNYELIQDTFSYQCINDHTHNGKHISLLMPYQDLGFTREEFLKYRDACWIQKKWSASITPKGAFFCEVAGAMDILFDGPGGWDLTSDWWNKEPKDFGEQLRWCDRCSACLPVPRLEARSGFDSVTKATRDILVSMGSRKPMKVLNPQKYNKEDYTANQSSEPYLPDEGNKARIASTNSTIKPKRIDAFIVCVGYADYLAETLRYNINLVDSITIITDLRDNDTEAVYSSFPEDIRKSGKLNLVRSFRIHENKAVFAKGKAINEALNAIKPTDWVLIMDADVILPSNFTNLKHHTLNPGTLYYTRRWGPERLQDLPEFLRHYSQPSVDINLLKKVYSSRRVARVEGRVANDIEHLPFGYFQLFNVNAEAVKNRKPIYPEKSNTAEYDDKEFGFEVFPKHKTVSLPVPEFEVIHLPHGRYMENWRGRISPALSDIKAGKISFKGVYVCEKKCQYKGKIYNIGDELTTEDIVPIHFRRK